MTREELVRATVASCIAAALGGAAAACSTSDCFDPPPQPDRVVVPRLSADGGFALPDGRFVADYDAASAAWADASCDAACTASHVTSCEWTDSGVPGERAATCTIDLPESCGEHPLVSAPDFGSGRAPDGFASRVDAEDWEQAFDLEAASVIAFRHLRRDLVRLGAPRALVKAASRARADEARHARAVRSLTGRRSMPPRALAQRMAERAAPYRARPLVEVAIENVVHGCIGEALGAIEALRRAERAHTEGERARLRVIASEEAEHAALALAVHRWARGRLGAEARARVDAAAREAYARVASRLGA